MFGKILGLLVASSVMLSGVAGIGLLINAIKMFGITNLVSLTAVNFCISGCAITIAISFYLFHRWAEVNA